MIIDLNVTNVIGNVNIPVSNVSMDSRHVGPHTLFVAVKGYTVDGHDFIKQAVEKNASAIICETLPSELDKNITYIVVNDTSYALGFIASAFYNYPSSGLKLIGITGTNGKTTTATLLYNLFKESGCKAGLMSTVVNRIDDIVLQSTHTTPDQITLNRLLSKMVDHGCEYCFMEVSSHAVVQNRISGLIFSGGVFTNLTHDHLDFHKDFKSYRDAKKLFFDSLPDFAFALSNSDDPNGHVMLQNTKARKMFYSLRKPSQFKGIVVENSMEGLHMRINRNDVHFKLRGKFNAYNLLAIFGVAMLLEQEEQDVLTILSSLSHVDGRFHIIENPRGVHCIVDYAHTPDAIENVLKTIDEIRTRNEQLIVVVGAGGNRDKAKRPVMASISARFADVLILTSDNPRNEDALDILNDMKTGLDSVQLSSALTIPDRREAIKTAVMMAKQGDIILVAGKGHETYQEIKGERFPFDDKKILFDFLNT